VIYFILSTAILVVGTFFISWKKMDDLTHAILLSLVSPILYLPVGKVFAVVSGLAVGFLMSLLKVEITDTVMFHVAGALSILISVVGLFLIHKIVTNGEDGNRIEQAGGGNDG
jgi:hypothetical protein